jgi:hypothetical protein
MKVQIHRFAVVFVGACSLAACESQRAWDRAGTDLAVIVTSPVTIPLNGVYDALDWHEDSAYADRYDPPEPDDWTQPVAEDSSSPAVASVVTVPLHVTKHALYTVVHAVDLVFSPFYLLAGFNDDRRSLIPLDLYSLEEGYPWKSKPFPYFEDDRRPFYHPYR